MNIPFIDLSKTISLMRDEVLASWGKILDDATFVGGPWVAELESLLKEKLSVPHALACANGTDAILIGLQAMGVKAGDTVALPNLTFWATYEAVVQLGATPVLIDCDPSTLQIDFSEFREAFERFRFNYAIIVHLMGWTTPQLHEFRNYCLEHQINLLEDGAQSFGVMIDNESVYSEAQIGTISFYPAKVLGGCMDGGAIVGTNRAWVDRARVLCNHGRTSHYSYESVGWNSRMGGLQAAYLCHFIQNIDPILQSRRGAFDRYIELLKDKHPALKAYSVPQGVTGNGYLATFLLEGIAPDSIAAILRGRGIGTGRIYPETIDQQPPAKNALRVSNLSHSRSFCQQVINLPLYFGITEVQLREVAAAMLSALQETCDKTVR